MKAISFKSNYLLVVILFFILFSACSNSSDSEDDNMINDDTEITEEEQEEQQVNCNSTEIFSNETTNAVCFEIVNNVRKVYTNNFPSHEYGPWAGPNTIMAQDFEYSMCLYPELTNVVTEIKEDPNSQSCGAGIIFGVSDQGINYSPFARLYWVNPNTQEENLDWHIEADFTLSMDLNGGHVNSVSRYHYHNIPEDYFENDLNIDGTSHSPLLGYAADGFPIYYKYLYTDNTGTNTNISEFSSGYSLKTGSRPGNGITAPNGNYDGTYIEDYEYTGSDLDECGGRFGITPEYPKGTYYYVLTDNWPYIPRCFKGRYVDNSFKISPGCPESTATQDCSSIEVIANANIFENLKRDLDTNLYNKLNLFEFGNEYAIAEITKVNIYKEDGLLAYSSNSKSNYETSYLLKSGVCYVEIEFLQGQIIKKIII